MAKHVLKLTCLLGGGSRQLVVSDDLAGKSFIETYKQWPLASKKICEELKGQGGIQVFFLPSPVPEEKQQRLHSCLS